MRHPPPSTIPGNSPAYAGAGYNGRGFNGVAIGTLPSIIQGGIGSYIQSTQDTDHAPAPISEGLCAQEGNFIYMYIFIIVLLHRKISQYSHSRFTWWSSNGYELDYW